MSIVGKDIIIMNLILLLKENNNKEKIKYNKIFLTEGWDCLYYKIKGWIHWKTFEKM